METGKNNNPKSNPLYLVCVLFFLISSITLSIEIIRTELKNMGDLYIMKIDKVIRNVEKETILAIKNIDNCQTIGESLIYSNDIRELFLIDNYHATCSSKRGKIKEKINIKNRFDNLSHHLVFWDIDEKPSERTIAFISPALNREGRIIISIIDRNHLIGGLFDINETNISKMIVDIAGKIYPVRTKFRSDYIHNISSSNKYKYSILIELKKSFVYTSVINAILISAIITIIILSISQMALRKTKKRGSLFLDFQEGLRRAEFYLEYQPIVDACSCKVNSLEVLVRWDHPTLGLIRPGAFIPLAEEKGLINELTDYILKWALKELALSKKGYNISLSVNIPPTYLACNKNLFKLTYYQRQFSKLDIELVAEITERQLLDKSGIQTLNKLKKSGLKIAIDDFGTGHTSLSVIQELNFDYLKIDKCFTDTIGINTVNSTVLDTIIELGHRLDVKIVAEGVETKEQIEHLKCNGVQKMQGYYFSRPVPLIDIKLD
ncbi:EAL domain-containing protein [Vibrio jasicida]|uniref:EAL domain-containing protein n=1 Tax=Vibrio jasicida TaxID=766224 RepID=A0AAU9QGQ3_9VIBR|nr:EAL domain-containing protein [Vibrio jasicida]CAH1570225.1 EAL domain-containing protein [Vibrio jasicida]